MGERMTEVAGEVADGLLVHAFTTERYVREVTLPALERGLARAGRSRGDVQLMCPVFVVTGRDEEERARLDQRDPQPGRLLRLHARLPGRPRGPRVG